MQGQTTLDRILVSPNLILLGQRHNYIILRSISLISSGYIHWSIWIPSVWSFSQPTHNTHFTDNFCYISNFMWTLHLLFPSIILMVKLPRRCNQLCFKMKNQVHPLLCVYVRNKNNYTTFIFSFIFGTRNESHDVVDYLYCIIPRWLRQK